MHPNMDYALRKESHAAAHSPISLEESESGQSSQQNGADAGDRVRGAAFERYRRRRRRDGGVGRVTRTVAAEDEAGAGEAGGVAGVDDDGAIAEERTDAGGGRDVGVDVAVIPYVSDYACAVRA